MAETDAPVESYSVGPLQILPGEHLARADGRALMLSTRELRLKLGVALPEWRFIHTHFGFGYRLAAERGAIAAVDSQVVHKKRSADGQTEATDR